MSVQIQYIRRLEKRTVTPGERPEIPPGTDHTDGTWDDKDIYVGELFINLRDKLLFTRDDNDNIVLLAPFEKSSFLGSNVEGDRKITISHNLGVEISGVFLKVDGKNINPANYDITTNGSTSQVIIECNFPYEGETINYTLL